MRGVTSKRRRQRAGARTSLRTLGWRRRARAGGIHAAGIWSLGSSRLVSVTEPASSRRSLASGEPPAEREVGAGAPRGACDPGMPSPCRRRQETPLPLPGVARTVAAFRPLSRSGTVRTPSAASVQAAARRGALLPAPRAPTGPSGWTLRSARIPGAHGTPSLSAGSAASEAEGGVRRHEDVPSPTISFPVSFGFPGMCLLPSCSPKEPQFFFFDPRNSLPACFDFTLCVASSCQRVLCISSLAVPLGQLKS